MPGGFDQEPERLSVRGKADFVICLDVTGSMAGCIRELGAKMSAFVDALEKPVENEAVHFSLKDWRGRFLPYRDLNTDGAEAMIESLPFVNSASALRKQLEDLPKKAGADGPTPAWGGGDEPESTLDAIYRAARKSDWRPKEGVDKTNRFIIVFTDATTNPVLHPDSVGGEGLPNDLVEVRTALAKEKVKLILFGPPCDAYRSLVEAQRPEIVQKASRIFLSREEALTFFKNADKSTEFQALLTALAMSISRTSGEITK